MISISLLFTVSCFNNSLENSTFIPFFIPILSQIKPNLRNILMAERKTHLIKMQPLEQAVYRQQSYTSTNSITKYMKRIEWMN